MKRLLLVALAMVACGPSGPYLPCARQCHQDYSCPPGEPNPLCEAALADCLDDCHMSEEP